MAFSASSSPEVDAESPTRTSPAAFAIARETRPEVCGSYAPERPYPIYLRGVVERGFGRGGKDLGCPTANLPSKVIQNHPSLQRTGIYYGFARILPQDPDDPDLLDEEDNMSAAVRSGNGSTPWPQGDRIDGGVGGDDDVDVQTDDDGDELVLSASPVNEENEIDLLEQASENKMANVIFKPRQLSRSSGHSAQSVKTILEKAGALNLERTGSGGSGQALTSESSPLSPTLSSSASKPDSASPSQSSLADKHPRDLSATSSQASSMRRKKKRRIPITSQDARVYPMVMSVGWNPFYKNTTKTAEVHILHNFKDDFYGLEMRVVVLGYIRPEYNYVSKEALIEDIEMDKKVAINSLARNPYQDYVTDPFLLAPS